jgi:predicted metal-dependent phosphoesterase TrpH
MAHPLKYKATRTKILRILADFIDCGGRAMEVLSGLQKPTDTGDLARIANQLGLLASTGSDFHAPGQHWSELGAQGRLPDNVVPVWQHWQ